MKLGRGQSLVTGCCTEGIREMIKRTRAGVGVGTYGYIATAAERCMARYKPHEATEAYLKFKKGQDQLKLVKT